MTRYILNSGGLRGKPELSREFFTEIVSGLGSCPRLLLCYFAKPRKEWEKKYSEDKKEIPKFIPKGVSPVFDLALPSKLERQLKDSVAIYILGGDDDLIISNLKRFNLPRIWEGKTVATNSASSHALSRYFWSCDARTCGDGLGILPIKFLAHYNSDYGSDDSRGPINWKKAYIELKGYGNKKLPIHALEEGYFITIEISNELFSHHKNT